MTRTYIPTALRQTVMARAAGRCEYCRYPQSAAFLTFEIEHIVDEKHGGATAIENLGLSCPFCNRYKGTDLGSLDPETGQLTAFFNPRKHVWSEHFQLDQARIIPRSAEGRVTVAILQLNHPDRMLEREQLMLAGQY